MQLRDRRATASLAACVLFLGIFVFEQGAVAQQGAAYWKFDEGSGNVAHDSSGNHNDGTIVRAAWGEGPSGKALALHDYAAGYPAKAGSESEYVLVKHSPSLTPHKSFDVSATINVGPGFEPSFAAGIVLFDAALQDSCTDKNCYNNKLTKNVERQIAEKPQLVQITNEWRTPGNNAVLGRNRENAHPLEEAFAFYGLLHTDGLQYDIASLAAKTGKSPAFVATRLRLVELHPSIAEAFLADEIGVGHALEIAKLPQQEQQRAFDAAFHTAWNGEKETRILRPVRDLTAWIEQNILLSLDSVAFDKNDEALVPEAGSCADCPKRTGFNTL
jgi:hypothetical protein